MTLKHPDELQDKDILTNLDAHRGAGVQFGEFICKKGHETPFQFIGRVKGEYRAWYNGKEAEEARKARAAQVSNPAQDEGPRIAVPASARVVQEPEASLEAAIKAQVARLTEEYTVAKARERELIKEIDEGGLRLCKIARELFKAEQFLKELEEGGDTPQVPQAVGRNIHPKMGPRKPRRGPVVGPSSDPEVGGSSSEGAGKGATGAGEGNFAGREA